MRSPGCGGQSAGSVLVGDFGALNDADPRVLGSTRGKGE